MDSVLAGDETDEDDEATAVVTVAEVGEADDTRSSPNELSRCFWASRISRRMPHLEHNSKGLALTLSAL